MTAFHTATFRLLGCVSQVSATAVSGVEDAEQKLGIRFPASVREWYCYRDAIDILAKYSNQDPPIQLREFAVRSWNSVQLLPFKRENQGVCLWSILLDGSDDPPVYVGVDAGGTNWNLLASTFSAYVYACVWDYVCVLNQPVLVQAQNEPLSSEALAQLRERFSEQPPTHGWPGSTQHRFSGKDHAILIWSGERQADWFVGSIDSTSLEAALRTLWELDSVGKSLYDCSEIGKAVLGKIRSGT